MRQRQGFTLIELLIVIVIVGILAAIAIPKFGAVRERAHFKAMQSDLRNLNTYQELYYTRPINNYTYGNDLSLFPDFQVSNGVTITINEATTNGWAAEAVHAALVGGKTCAIYIGSVAAPPAYASGPGIVSCTGE